MQCYTFRRRPFAQTLYAALCQDPFYVTLETTVDACPQQEGMVKYMDYSMREGEVFGELFVPEKYEHGASVWIKPLEENVLQEMKRRKKAFLRKQLGEQSLKTYNDIVEFMSAKAASLVGEQDWYLSIVGVAPEFQGRGIGPGLINGVLRHADRSAVDTYLETFCPRNIPFYERLGYQVAGRFHEPTTDEEYALMIRRAQTA